MSYKIIHTDRNIQVEQFKSMTEQYTKILDRFDPKQKQYLDNLKRKINQLIDNQIQSPVEGTNASRWQSIKSQHKMNNIEGLDTMDILAGYQFAYTLDKGKITKLCVADSDGFVDPNVNLYVLIHELTHIYDIKYLPGEHDAYFWILYSKLIMRAISLGILDPKIFNKKQCDCDTDILDPQDYQKIQDYSKMDLPQRQM